MTLKSVQILQKQDGHNMQNQENNVFSRSSLQCLCGNLCNWAYDIRLYIASTNEPKSAQKAKKFFYMCT